MNTRAIIHLVHFFIFGSLFLYIGIKRTEICSWLFPVLLVLGVIIWAYHGYKTYVKYTGGKNPWVNILHILYIAPILVYIGVYKTETPRFVFEMMLMLGFAVAGYHGMYALEDAKLFDIFPKERE